MANMVLILASLLSVGLAVQHDTSCHEGDIAVPDTGHVLLQARQTQMIAKFKWQDVGGKSGGIGSTAPLTEDGYAAVAAGCCNMEMFTFASRVVGELSLELCDKGGLAGLVIWYNCGNASSLDALQKNLLASQPPEKCAFVAKPGTCPAKDPSCVGKFDPNFLKECSEGASESTTVALTTTTTTTTTTTEMCAGYCPAGRAGSVRGKLKFCVDNYMEACVYPGCIGGGLTNAGAYVKDVKNIQECHQACMDKTDCTWFKFSMGMKGATWSNACSIVSDIPWNGTDTKGTGIYKFDTSYTHFLSCVLERP